MVSVWLSVGGVFGVFFFLVRFFCGTYSGRGTSRALFLPVCTVNLVLPQTEI